MIIENFTMFSTNTMTLGSILLYNFVLLHVLR